MKNILLNVCNIQQLLKAKLVRKKMRGVLSSSRKRKKLLEFLKNLKENHNHSWYEEVYSRNKNNLEKVALFYRGNELRVADTITPTFEVADVVLEDIKNILSCEVVNVKNYNGQDVLVAHIELQLDRKKEEAEILAEAYKRIKYNFDSEVVSRILFRLRSNEESYPLTGCGKRNGPALEEEGVSEYCVEPVYYFIKSQSNKKQDEDKTKQLIKF